MVKKKKEETTEEVPEEIPEIEDVEEPKEITQEEKIEQFYNSLNTWQSKMEKAINVNQKYIKGMWERLKLVEDNFKIHLEKS